MNLAKFLFLLLAVVSTLWGCMAQPHYGENYLKIEKTIVLPNVKGRIDHMDVNLKDEILYMAALGNNSLEVVDIRSGKWIHSIKGLDEPQGVGYVPQTGEIFVANGGNGDCYFFNSTTFEKTATIQLSSDADDVRYDSVDRKIYVGYGSGGIAVIDAIRHQQIADVKLPVHPEGFQLDRGSNRLFVNLPDNNSIGVIDLKELKLIEQWKRSSPTSNFPMAVDTVRHEVFIGYRHPPSLLLIDGKTGKEKSSTKMISDVDDLYFDEHSNTIIISGGGGAINIFARETESSFKQISSIPTRPGARTSLFIPKLNLFVLAERAEGGQSAAVIIYSLADN